MTDNAHGAASSAVGYLYQTRWGLVELLQRGAHRPDQAISLELHDDVSWESAGNATELLQLKHHTRGSGALTDMSTDLWKTINVWVTGATPSDPDGPLLTLVTTSTAPVGSAASMLRPDSRDEAGALASLVHAAETSQSDATARARSRFLQLGAADRQILLSRVVVLDQSGDISSLDEQAKRSLLWTLPRAHPEVFLRLVWAWWDAISIDILTGRRAAVEVGEAQARIGEIRDQFNADSLPTLVELSAVDHDSVQLTHSDSIFVHQMRWIRLDNENLSRSIIDYYRAVTQTTEWVANDLVGLHELEKFESNLKDEWARVHADMVADLPDDADEATKARAGLELFRKLRDSTAVSVRRRYNDPFYARGKRHELAEAGTIGWHADFEELVRRLLLPAS